MNLEKYHQIYEKMGCVQLPPILSAQIVDFLVKSFDSKFEKRAILAEKATEYSVANPLINIKLDIIFNTPEFLEQMSGLTGTSIRMTRQRLYYTDPECHALPWHDDSYDSDSRVAAIRFELSDNDYEGGTFYLRNAETENKFEKLKFGESVLFKVEYNKLFHKVEPITMGIRKSLILFLCE